MFNYNPFIGCLKCSPSCDICPLYYRGNYYYNGTFKSKSFDIIIKKKRKGGYLIKGNSIIDVSTNVDFFIEQADSYRDDVFSMFNERKDLTFNIKTKRISRLLDLNIQIPDNVHIYCVVCNQIEFNQSVSALLKLNIKHKHIIIHPLYEKIRIKEVLNIDNDIIDISLFGDDFFDNPLRYEDVYDLSNDTKDCNIAFNFVSTGRYFIKDNKRYYIKYDKRYNQAYKSKLSHD